MRVPEIKNNRRATLTIAAAATTLIALTINRQRQRTKLIQNRTKNLHENLSCDYLIVGAGTSGLSFIDTILSENPTATVVLVDRNSCPGGHWTTAYPFVRLHQPSCFYGVNSLPLGTVRDWRGREVFNRDDRATAAEILEYYERVVAKFKSCGRVKCFFGAEYKAGEEVLNKSEGDTPTTYHQHTFVSACGKAMNVRCIKIVTVSSKVVVPSMRKPLIPVHESVNFIPVNGLPGAITSKKYTKYVVIGAGKTGVDAVIELLSKGVDQSQIQWIISRDVWYFILEEIYKNNNSFIDTVKFMRCFLEGATLRDTFLAVEKIGFVARLDPDGPFPEVCKAPIVSAKDLGMLRNVKDVVRWGRVTSIDADNMTLEKGSLPFSNSQSVFIDCMAEGFYGYGTIQEGFKIFEPKRVNLGPLCIVNNSSFSSAFIAYVESTFKNDEIKNSMFFLLTGKHTLGTPTTIIGGFYAQMKTVNALVKRHFPAALFLLNSRTNADSLNNRGGSVLDLLWSLYGPLQLDKMGENFIQKIDNGGFSDLNHCFGVGRPI